MSRMARLIKTGVFLPTTLRRGTCQNSIRFFTCKRTTQSIQQIRTHGRQELPGGSAAFIPLRKRRGLRRELVKRQLDAREIGWLSIYLSIYLTIVLFELEGCFAKAWVSQLSMESPVRKKRTTCSTFLSKFFKVSSKGTGSCVRV